MAFEILRQVQTFPDKRVSKMMDLILRRFLSKKGDALGRVILQAERFMARPGTPASYTTAGVVTYTIADILTQCIVRDCNGASRADVLPTAALIVAGVPGLGVGDHIDCKLVNGSDAAETITVGVGTGGALDAAQLAGSNVVLQNSSRTIKIVMTNVTAGAEAYVAYV